MSLAKVKKVSKDIKSLKIQGATNVAIAALNAWYSVEPRNQKRAKEQLLSTRPTEPMLSHVLKAAENGAKKKDILNYIKYSEEEISDRGAKLIKNGMIVFTHCHSSTVVNILKKAKAQGKKFEVYNTETRPLFQGRLTAKDLVKAGIKVTHFIDSAAMAAMKKADLFLFGADAITKDGVYNKIGTEMFAEVAHTYFKIPVYSCSISWKYIDKTKVEQRDEREVWLNRPRGVKIYNPAFELAEKKFLNGIITEIGVIKPNEIIKKLSNIDVAKQVIKK